MTNPPIDLRQLLHRDEFPRSGNYDPEWVLENLMGPNVLWLTEALTQVMELRRGMRVLDLGCGKAVSSVFLAKEFGVQVWAADLWIKPTDNRVRIDEAGLSESVFPISVEAHTLPFAEGFFDAIVSMDAFHYFGTDDLYTGYIARYLKPGGTLGIVVPGLQQDFHEVPDYLAPQWVDDFWSFHSPAWWRRHWERSGAVRVEHADLVPNGWEQWKHWLEACKAAGHIKMGSDDMALVEADGGRSIGFSRVVGRKA